MIWIVLAVVTGAALAVLAARRLPGILRSGPAAVLVGGAIGAGAVLVALLALWTGRVGPGGGINRAALASAVLVGAGSAAVTSVVYLRRRGTLAPGPVILPWFAPLIGVGLVVGVGLAGGVAVTGNPTVGLLLALAAIVLGALVVLPVRGSDVPEAAGWLAVAGGAATVAVGLALVNPVVVGVGTFVAVWGAVPESSPQPAARLSAESDRSADGQLQDGQLQDGQLQDGQLHGGRPEERPGTKQGGPVGPADVAAILGAARKVVVVPGFGLAAAQAQHTLRHLADLLETEGVEVVYGIHPVAGRMPGHLNVVLADAEVPYEAQKGVDDVNPEFDTTDVALVVGADDVVNPAAITSPGTPLYGMPYLEVARARRVVVLTRSLSPGFAGVENELLHDPKTAVLLGDAEESLTQVLGAVKAALLA